MLKLPAWPTVGEGFTSTAGNRFLDQIAPSTNYLRGGGLPPYRRGSEVQASTS